MRQWETVPASRIMVVPNGIDTKVYGDRLRRNELRQRLGLCHGGAAADAVVIGSVGRLSEVKRQDLLLRAVASLTESFPQLRLLLVGDGPERQRLEELAAKLGIAERTVFAGYQANPEEYLAAMDLFALTSRHEALPLALLEAWASGLPVVASAVGGIPKVVEQGRTGLLFPSGDCQALVASLRNVLSDKGLASKLARAGVAEVQAKYSLQQMAENYGKQYQAATQKHT
jgi:glycosyltransferase involved in cell wall biosynthesis